MLRISAVYAASPMSGRWRSFGACNPVGHSFARLTMSNVRKSPDRWGSTWVSMLQFSKVSRPWSGSFPATASSVSRERANAGLFIPMGCISIGRLSRRVTGGSETFSTSVRFARRLPAISAKNRPWNGSSSLPAAIEEPSFGELERELKLIESSSDPYVQEFADGLSELIAMARREKNPVVFV